MFNTDKEIKEKMDSDLRNLQNVAEVLKGLVFKIDCTITTSINVSDIEKVEKLSAALKEHIWHLIY